MNTNEISSKANCRKNRIKATSRVLRTVLFAALIVQIIGIVGLFIAIPAAIFDRFKSEIVFTNLGSCAIMPFSFMVTLSFFRFFNRLKDGHLFDAQTVSYLEMAGKWWILLGIAQAVFQALQAYLFHPRNINVSGSGIVAGLIIFFIGWVLREAQELKEEQELTV